MSWKQHLFKPKWQNKDAEIRLHAVSSDHDPGLLELLAKIAGQDEVNRVRSAAIKRLHDLEMLLQLYAGESDISTRSVLEDRIGHFASMTGDDRPAIKFRLQVTNETTDRNLIEQIAVHAPEAELRRAALNRVTRQGVVGDCCINDPDSANRQLAASLVTQHTTLKRVIEALRTRDKALYSRLQQRLHQELLQKGDARTIRTEALNICVALEKLAISGQAATSAAVKVQKKAWQQIDKQAGESEKERYKRVIDRLTSPPAVTKDPLESPEEKPVPKPTESEAATATEAPDIQEEQQAGPNQALAGACQDLKSYQAEYSGQIRSSSVNKLRKRLEKAWKQCPNPNPEDKDHWSKAGEIMQLLEVKLERQTEQEQQLSDQAGKLLSSFEQELEEGSLHKALTTRSELLGLGQKIINSRSWQEISTTMQGMQARLKELRDWQHWSNDKIRKRLIAEMEVLPAADLHPDALLDRIKSLQAEWKSLGESEQIPGEKHFAAAPWMWRKFSAAGHTAFESARDFLDKRSEIQSRQAQSLATFCAELEQLATAEPVDMTALAKGMNRGRKKLHDLNNIPSRQRQKIARQLKSALDSANSVIQAQYEHVEKAKMKLIRSASQLVHLPDRSEAITNAKALQAQWKAAGSLWRSREQTLWTQFRDHLDPLFAELKEQQVALRSAETEKRDHQKALCDELKQLLNSEAELKTLQGKIQGLEDQWRDIEHADKRLLQSFQKMVADYHQSIENQGKQERKEHRERWWQKSSLLHKLSSAINDGEINKKSLQEVETSWPSQSSDDELEKTMDKKFTAMLESKGANQLDVDQEDLKAQARELCIRIEFVAGLSSPRDDREQRMQYQVDRLAASMSGESVKLPAAEEAREVEKAWLGMYILPEPEFSLFGSRIQTAISAIIEN